MHLDNVSWCRTGRGQARLHLGVGNLGLLGQRRRVVLPGWVTACEPSQRDQAGRCQERGNGDVTVRGRWLRHALGVERTWLQVVLRLIRHDEDSFDVVWSCVRGKNKAACNLKDLYLFLF